MTNDSLYPKAGRGGRTALLLPLLLLFLFLLFAGEVVGAVRGALSLCAGTILPTLFPFMILSDLLGEAMGAASTDERGGSRGGVLRRLFGVPRIGMGAFLLGALCGFPLGVKHAVTLYRQGRLTIGELENLLTFCNNTGPAFVIAGVGLSLFGSQRTGLLLYGVQILSALLVGLLLTHKGGEKGGGAPLKMKVDAPSRSGGLLAAVGRSTQSILSVCGLLIFFSAVCAVVAIFCKNKALLMFIYSFLEVGGASQLAASLYAGHPLLSLIGAASAISFGGLSVLWQAELFLGEIPVRRHRYLLAKLMQALFSALLITLLCQI